MGCRPISGQRRWQVRYAGSVKSLGFVLFLAACGFKSTPGEGPVDGNGGGVADSNGGSGGSDSGKMIDAAIPLDAQVCFGKGLQTGLCLDAAPSMDRTLSANIDTGTATNCTKTIAQNGGAITNRHDLVEPMGDIDDSNATVPEHAHEREQSTHLGGAQSRGRLVHDDEASLDRQRAGDLDHLLVRDAEVAHQPLRFDR